MYCRVTSPSSTTGCAGMSSVSTSMPRQSSGMSLVLLHSVTTPHKVEERLIRHLIELLQNSPRRRPHRDTTVAASSRGNMPAYLPRLASKSTNACSWSWISQPSQLKLNRRRFFRTLWYSVHGGTVISLLPAGSLPRPTRTTSMRASTTSTRAQPALCASCTISCGSLAAVFSTRMHHG